MQLIQFIIWIAWNLNITLGLYDAKSSINQRVQHLKTVCDKYRNKYTYEHEALFSENINDPSKNYVQNVASKFFICIPPENGALYWNRLLREIHNLDMYNDMKVIENFKGGTISELYYYQ